MIHNTILKDFGFVFAELICSKAENRKLSDAHQPSAKKASSSLITALNLKKEQNHLFCYPVKTWLDAMVGMLGICTTRKEGCFLLEKFLDAHLVHFPYNRSQRKVSAESSKLQPTAKGIAILEIWFYGQPFEVSERMDEVRAILQSPFNTMELISLERAEDSGRLYISTGICILLWNRMFGMTPQIYDGPENLDDSAQNMRMKTHLKKRLNPLTLYNRQMSPDELNADEKQAYDVFGFNPYATNIANKKYHPVVVRELNFDEVPYYSRSMVHPNSNNVMQYFDKRGLRFFSSLKFERRGKTKFHNSEVFEAENIVSGRSIWQWIMDCTTVASSTEGSMVAKMMLENGFLARVEELVVDSWAAIGSGDHINSSDHFLGNDCLYRFTPRGRRLIGWGYDVITEECLDQRTLREDRIYSSFVTRESDASPSSVASSASGGSTSSSLTIEITENFEDAMPFMRMNGNGNFSPSTKLPTPPSPTRKSSFKQPQRNAHHRKAKHRPPSINLDVALAPSFSGQNWGWEYMHDNESAEAKFENNVDINVILSEPALRLLFRDYLHQKHCRGVLDFIDRSQSLLHKIEKWSQSKGTVTLEKKLKKSCQAYISDIQKLHIDKGSPFEINICDQMRQSWYFSVSMSLEGSDFLPMVPVLAALRAECWHVLEGCVMDFKQARTVLRIPTFQQYIITKTVPRSQPQTASVLT